MTKRTKPSTENSGKNSERGSSAGAANLKPWQPGESGNPGGRPATAPLSQACRKVLTKPVPNDPEGRSYAEVIAQTLADRAITGDIQAAREIADRGEGKARQSIEIENVGLREAFARMKPEELIRYAETGQLPQWFTDYTEMKHARPN